LQRGLLGGVGEQVLKLGHGRTPSWLVAYRSRERAAPSVACPVVGPPSCIYPSCTRLRWKHLWPFRKSRGWFRQWPEL